jgi:hypothetical protein
MGMIESKEFLDFVMNFTKIMKEERIILSYDGVVSQDILMAFTSLTEKRLSQIETNKKVKKNVYHVMVEYLQNIVKHTDSNTDIHDVTSGESFMKSGIFIVGKRKTEYFVTSGNLILNSKIERMKYVLDNLNLMDYDGLSELYKQTMKDGSISLRGGAGLGLIDIARKTGRPFTYHFEYVNDDFSFFVLNSTINREDA